MVLASLFITSPDTHSERRLDTDITVGQLKDKLVPITGIAQQHQALGLYRNREALDKGEQGVLLSDEAVTLAQAGVQEWACIKVVNSDPNARPGEFSDLSQVEKFELTDAEYAAKNDTLRAHLKAHKLGQYADEPHNLTYAPPPPTSAPADVIPGARCEVGSDQRGTVRFVGEASIGKGGVWVGVELDEPTGKGDGSVEGTRYFTTQPKHAIFVRSDKVTIGDFPEQDLMADDDEI